MKRFNWIDVVILLVLVAAVAVAVVLWCFAAIFWDKYSAES